MAYDPSQPREAKGLPQGVAGTWRKTEARHADADMHQGTPPELMMGEDEWRRRREENRPDIGMAKLTYAMREEAARNREEKRRRRVVFEKDERETRALLEEADRVEFGPDGAVLYDKDGGIVFREDPAAPPLNRNAMRSDRRVQDAARSVFRGTLDDMPAKDRRRLVQSAHRYASPYSRRVAIDESPNRRYLPADSMARSLASRRDQEASVRVLADIFNEDANAAANIVRSGFPNTRETAMSFINKTKIQRYKKDTRDKVTGEIHHKGDAVIGKYVGKRGKNAGREITGPLPNPKGATTRSYLYMTRVARTNGVPEPREATRMAKALSSIENPEAQARAFWQVCYGRDAMPDDRIDAAKRAAVASGANVRGMRELTRYTAGDGQGNAARVIAYQKPLSREAAVAFCALASGDDRLANTRYTRRRRDKATGEMRDVTPKRLTEMRSYIHAVYQVSDDDVNAYLAAHSMR